VDSHPKWFGAGRVGRGLLCAAAVSCVLSCRERPTDTTESKVGAVTGSITISGAISDANGLPLGGVTVHLDGTSQAVVVESTGTYSFSGLRTGSYSVRPTLNGCSFVPDVVNLNNLSTNAVQNFGGSGASCGGTATVNTGATTGALTISGHVRDASGTPIVGAQINLNGTTSAIRFSDFTGGYTFHVGAGSYALAVTGACALTPANASFNNMTASQTQNFTRASGTCVTSAASSVVASGELLTLQQAGSTTGQIFVNIVPEIDQAHAVTRLQTIGGEQPNSPSRSVTIAGLPAIERQVLVPVFGSEHDAGPLSQPFTLLGTSIASAGSVVRFTRLVPGTASQAVATSFFTMARNFTPEETAALHGSLPVVRQRSAPHLPATPPPLPLGLASASVNQGVGEMALAASAGNVILYASNTLVSFSSDAGKTVSRSTLSPDSSGATNGGDPSAAVGAPNGQGAQTFYYSALYDTGVSAPGGDDFRIGVLRSVDGGQTFTRTASVPLDCSVAPANPDGSAFCRLPDQPQLAADSRTQSMQGGDNLYVAWRQTTNGDIGVSCSSDGGDTWTTPNITVLAGGDVPRMTVGPDGDLSIAFENRSYFCLGNGKQCSDSSTCCGGVCASGTCQSQPGVTTNFRDQYVYTLSVQRFSSCDSGFLPRTGFPTQVAQNINPLPAVAGLDRIPEYGPYMVVPDDSDTTGHRSFVIWIDETKQDLSLIGPDGAPALASDDIHLAESRDGENTWVVSPNTINTVSNGHRFLPWACSSKGIVYVTWYDRRDATKAASDLTAYFYRSFVDQANSGNPIMGAEVNVSGGTSSAFDDPECDNGFPDYTTNPDEEVLCTDLPPLPAEIFGGRCLCTDTTKCSSSSGVGCDFRETTPCTTPGESCVGDRGIPEYGDYNGAACVNGQLFMAWATTTAPVGTNCAVQGGACSATTPCCNGFTCNGSGLCAAPTSGATCVANKATCATNGDCCSFNCQGNACQPRVNIFESSTNVRPALSCATTLTPDVTASGDFDFDTGSGPGAVQGNYGQPDCVSQYLVDVDLTAAAFQNKSSLDVSGVWSAVLPPTPCDEQSVMAVFVLNASGNWQIWDQVPYLGELSQNVCEPIAQSHSNPDAVGFGVSVIPLTMGFTRARIAVNATEGTTDIPVAVAGQIF
jgi:hypothetical protein